MPADRFIHPKLGHSERVTLLTDFQYRVWTQYLLSADDFGVMRASAVTLQSDNDALDAKKPAVVQRALEHLILVGLLHVFTHQDRHYAYQRDWQTFQKVEWPRTTIQPKPDEEALRQCALTTRELFSKHPGGVPKRRGKIDLIDSATVLRTLPEHSPNTSRTLPERTPSLARARARETLTLTLTANANANAPVAQPTTPRPAVEVSRPPPMNGTTDQELANRAGAFCERYAELYPLHRHGARYLPKPALDFPKACELCAVWDNARLERIAIVFLKCEEPFAQAGSRTIGQFAAMASWADARLREVETPA